MINFVVKMLLKQLFDPTCMEGGAFGDKMWGNLGWQATYDLLLMSLISEPLE